MPVLPIDGMMRTEPREVLAHVTFASQLVRLAAVLETSRWAHNGLARAAQELRRLGKETLRLLRPSAGRA